MSNARAIQACRPRLASTFISQGPPKVPQARTARSAARRPVRVFAQQAGTAIERADTRKGTLAHTVQEAVVSPFTAVPIVAGALVGYYLYHQGVDGASLGDLRAR